jgi:hypothetical protein
VGLTLTTQGPILMGGSLIGAGHSALFLLALKYFTNKSDVYSEKESKFVD